MLINTYYYPNCIGGAEESTKILAEGLKKRGNEVYVLTADGTKDEPIVDIIEGVKVIRTKPTNLSMTLKSIGRTDKIIHKVLEERNYLYEYKYKNILKQVNPDIIHTNNLYGFSTLIWKINSRFKIKTIHTARDYWGLCPKATLINRSGEICIKGNILCKIHEKNIKYFSKYVNYFTSPSNFTLNMYKKAGFFKNSICETIENSIQINISEHLLLKERKVARKGNIVKFLFMGGLTKHKGIKFLIDAFKKIDLENIELIICGDGKLKEYVMGSISDDKRIRYLGNVYADKKESILIESDVMIVPSLWNEPFGRVVIEAYKYCMPVIGIDIGGLSEVLQNGVSKKIKIYDEEKLIESIVYMENDYNRKNMIVNTTKYLKKYELERQLNAFEKIYKLLIKE